jgi:uncharacterized tellurite resistance protein B-like protein
MPLRTLKNLFETFITPSKSPQDVAHQLQLATAVLLTEVMRADPEIAPAERHSVVSTLESRFGLSGDETARLMELAGETAKKAEDFFRFTSAINDHFSHPQKIQMIENMWHVAYSDATLGAHEQHLISKIAGLLHVTHGEYIAAKLHAQSDTTG